MKIAIDTNRYVDFCRGVPEVTATIQQAQQIFLPYIVLGELRAGFQSGKRGLVNERFLIRFLNSPRVDSLFPDENTTHHYARLFNQLKRQGTPIPTNDLWLAALTIQHDLQLFTRDKHFEQIPQLLLVS
ncbi:MAG: hypothetical protein A3F82_11110 [Deltaproteobacteria bacterium RIFCSPLOWO2_12_FULL_44_12]|nr:MAG: hypothetical protein A2712_09110 [Deltaproteobacteria bacterium RIFCSPHIGHO2_01_FULL_43_49]OGQ14510.1 MAG: hypothetical protein A3D22_07890 [Deltaproteobacteria bacterium RIFCSPHIGHO2_02_FULL_44_53]OGQ27896.1 MAG: hypothetical protein A3D98_06600 [Deltaproteobacteria bacterium RIFCSPHIGHO2_12_FULL_44_21]OGQ31108.1 MAG: hypothetical protein A2979_06650 [Deltaproteobacteria bacterium RIFCSPLOWO2_01_FULL_45_74]OGQ43099.1 MAG: hypothetical protein A3I70_00305 [Deltaproteobacteria bacterium 